MYNKYDYMHATTKNVLDWIRENGLPEECLTNRDAAEEYLSDRLQKEDRVTGYESGVYWYCTQDAEKALSHNGDLLKEALDKLEMPVDPTNPDAMDVAIRRYLLPDAIRDALDNLEGQGYFSGRPCVLNQYNIVIDWDVAVQLMDDEIRGWTVRHWDGDTRQSFFGTYANWHWIKTAERWELDKKNPVY